MEVLGSGFWRTFRHEADWRTLTAVELEVEANDSDRGSNEDLINVIGDSL